jgi:hypothetical protein
MSNCDIKNYFSEYINEELSSRHISRFYHHLDKCADCSNQLEDFYRLHRMLMHYERVKPSDRILFEYSEGLHKTLIQPRKPRRPFPLWLSELIYPTSRWIRISEVVALLLIGLAGGWCIFSYKQSPKIIETSAISYSSKPISKEDLDYMYYYFQASEMILLEMSNITSQDLKLESDFINNDLAQKLLIKTFLIHEMALSLNDPSILGFLSKMEMILYDLSNTNEEEMDVTLESIKLVIEKRNLIEESRRLQVVTREPSSLPG